MARRPEGPLDRKKGPRERGPGGEPWKLVGQLKGMAWDPGRQLVFRARKEAARAKQKTPVDRPQQRGRKGNCRSRMAGGEKSSGFRGQGRAKPPGGGGTVYGPK